MEGIDNVPSVAAVAGTVAVGTVAGVGLVHKPPAAVAAAEVPARRQLGVVEEELAGR